MDNVRKINPIVNSEEKSDRFNKTQQIEPVEEPEFIQSVSERYFDSNSSSMKAFLTDVEKMIIMTALRFTEGNQRAAADLLVIKHTTLNEKIKKHSIQFKKEAYIKENSMYLNS